MATLEERVAYLEGRVEEHSKNVDGIREALVSLEHRVDGRLQTLDQQVQALERRMDGRFESVDGRFETLEGHVNARFNAVDGRFDALEAQMNARFEAIDGRMFRQFVWLVGVQVTTLAAVLGAFSAFVSALLH